MKYVIDRFEGDYAVCENENGEMVDISKTTLPSDYTEGTHFIEENGTYILNESERESREDMIKNLFDSLRK